jgi:hypothetical protein
LVGAARTFETNRLANKRGGIGGGMSGRRVLAATSGDSPRSTLVG